MRTPDLVLQSERLILSLPREEAARRILRYYQENADHHRMWDPPRPTGFYTLPYWTDRLLANRQEFLDDRSFRLLIARREEPDGAIVGVANFTSFSRGSFQACRLGYSLDQEAVGKGMMHEALQTALDYVFGTLRLHRVEANHVPGNDRSARLLRRLGFEIQGYARDYLFINGAWRDHVLTALTNPQAVPGFRPR